MSFTYINRESNHVAYLNKKNNHVLDYLAKEFIEILIWLHTYNYLA
jgi:hypothetical protein